jgi:hypothetical protein
MAVEKDGEKGQQVHVSFTPLLRVSVTRFGVSKTTYPERGTVWQPNWKIGEDGQQPISHC